MKTVIPREVVAAVAKELTKQFTDPEVVIASATITIRVTRQGARGPAQG